MTMVLSFLSPGMQVISNEKRRLLLFYCRAYVEGKDGDYGPTNLADTSTKQLR
jgi:hypothetical protein